MVLKMKIIKQELEFEECLKQRLEFICEFSKVTPTFINGSIRKLEKTNLTYIETHRVIIKIMKYVDDIELALVGKKVVVKQINFRESICKPCQELYNNGYIDTRNPMILGNVLDSVRLVITCQRKKSAKSL